MGPSGWAAVTVPWVRPVCQPGSPLPAPPPAPLPPLLCLGLRQPTCLAEANEVGRLVQFLAEAEAGVLAPGVERVGELVVLGFGFW